MNYLWRKTGTVHMKSSKQFTRCGKYINTKLLQTGKSSLWATTEADVTCKICAKTR